MSNVLEYANIVNETYEPPTTEQTYFIDHINHLSSIISAIKTSSDIDIATIASLRLQIHNGHYTINSLDIAKKLLFQ